MLGSDGRCTALHFGHRLLAPLLLAFYVISPAAMADAIPSQAPKSITVVLDDNYPPYIFRSETGVLQGILVDRWKLWEVRTGIAVNLQAMDWGKAQQAMQAGKVDVIDTIFETPARQKIYDFSAPYADLEVPIFFHKSIGGIVDAASLKGFTVGVKDGDACIDKLQENNVTNLRRFPSYETLVKNAAANEIRVFCIDKPPAIYLLYQLGLEREYRHSAPLYVGQFHRAVRKGNAAMLRLVEDGFARISADENKQIEAKWLGTPLAGRQLPLYARNAGYALLVFVLLALILVAWNRSLQGRVNRKTAELSTALAQLAVTLEAIPDLLFELDSDGRYLDYRANRLDLLAAPPQELLGHTLHEVMPAETADIILASLREAAEHGSSHGTLIRLSVPAGERWFELSVALKKGEIGEKQRFIVLSRDVTERKQAEADIERLAFFDPLTQLPNRSLLLDRLRQALAAGLRRNRHGALLVIDLDNFKTLNDIQGHTTGDLLLRQVATRLQACIRVEDTIARLGGDEFVVILEDLSADDEEAATQAETVGEKILLTLSHPYLLDEYHHHSTASIGISLFSGYAESEEELLKRADAAMYRAKTGGRNTLRFFDPAMQATLEARAKMETALRHALPKEQLQLYYQPQIDSEHGIIGAEALLRWLHPQDGMISPAQFIPLAEETGLIVPIGRWVLEVACAQLKRWEHSPLTRNLLLSVNVSARQFRQPDFVGLLRGILESSGADPSRLKLELTESLVLDNVADSIEKMHLLRAVGIRFSMDDFGTGYSSLSYLKRLPLDQLKIDQSFVRDITHDQGDAVIVQTIIGMANNLGLHVIAEGVETAAQRDFLFANGCRVYQGFLFSRPVPLAEFENLLP